MRTVVKRDGRADMPRDAVQAGADFEVWSVCRAEGEVLCAVYERLGIVEADELHAWMRIFRRDRLVAEVQRDAVAARFTDDAGEQHGGIEIVQVVETVVIAEVPKQCRAGAALVVGVLRVKWKCRRATSNHSRHW